MILLVASVSASASASASAAASPLELLVHGLAPRPESAADGRVDELGELLWRMAGSEPFARGVLERVDPDAAALTDTLVSFLRQSRPVAAAELDSLYVPRDRGPDPGDQPPSWPDVQWQGLRLLGAVAPEPGVGRDVRFAGDLERAMASTDRRAAATVAGIVRIVTRWWAERGEDPRFTHDPARIPDVDAWVESLGLPSRDRAARTAPHWIASLDADPVLRIRVLGRLDPDRHTFLASGLVEALRTLPEGFAAVGIGPRRWDPDRGTTVGHAVDDLWELSLEALERAVGRPFGGPDLTRRRLAALGWWEAAQWQARYWRDPTRAPDLARFLDGLEPEDGPPVPAARWVRSIYLERAVRDLVVDRLGPRHRPVVGELISLLPMPRAEAHRAGFAMAYRTQSIDGRSQLVSVDWDDARAFVRRVLEQLTGAQEPPGVSSLDPGAQASFWLDWWAAHRDDPQWSRPDAPVPDPPASGDEPRFETRRGRVD